MRVTGEQESEYRRTGWSSYLSSMGEPAPRAREQESWFWSALDASGLILCLGNTEELALMMTVQLMKPQRYERRKLAYSLHFAALGRVGHVP